jgi:hypothetical protein
VCSALTEGRGGMVAVGRRARETRMWVGARGIPQGQGHKTIVTKADTRAAFVAHWGWVPALIRKMKCREATDWCCRRAFMRAPVGRRALLLRGGDGEGTRLPERRLFKVACRCARTSGGSRTQVIKWRRRTARRSWGRQQGY